MGDILLALSIPVLVFGGGIYAAVDTWWRRGHPAPPSPYTHQAARLAEAAMLVDAERIVDGAYEAFGGLYDGTGARPPAAGAAPGAAVGPENDRPAPSPARRG